MSPANRSATFALILLVGFALAATALAQVEANSVRGIATNDPNALTRVDQGTADLGDLNVSNRLIPIDLRQPLDFDRLFRAPDDSGRLMRVSGGISAVFPRSEYAGFGGFVYPVIPAGTEYYIGPMPITRPTYSAPGDSLIDSRLDLASGGMTSGRLDGMNPPPINRIHARIHASNRVSDGGHGMTLEELLTGRPHSDTVEQETAPSVWSSERYRRGRIAALLARASEHGRGS